MGLSDLYICQHLFCDLIFSRFTLKEKKKDTSIPFSLWIVYLSGLVGFTTCQLLLGFIIPKPVCFLQAII